RLSFAHLLSLLGRRPPRSPLFPYTTLFRSPAARATSRSVTSRSSPNSLITSTLLSDFWDRAQNDSIAREGKRLMPLTDYLFSNTDRKSTRLNSSHVKISYAVFCLKKKTQVY